MFCLVAICTIESSFNLLIVFNIVLVFKCTVYKVRVCTNDYSNELCIVLIIDWCQVLSGAIVVPNRFYVVCTQHCESLNRL